MEIKIKTAQEFHDQHVTISIEAVPGTSWSLSDRPYTDDEVAHFQYAEGKLVDLPLTRQREIDQLKAELAQSREAVGVLDQIAANACTAREAERGRAERAEAELERRTGERDERERARAGLEAELVKAQQSMEAFARQVSDYNRDRHTEKDRADRSEGRAQAFESELAAARQTIEQLTADLEELQTEVNAQNERANQNKMWAERAEARLVVVENDRTTIRQVSESQREALDKIRERVWNDVISEAVSPGVDPAEYTNFLCRAVQEVRRVVGKPQA